MSSTQVMCIPAPAPSEVLNISSCGLSKPGSQQTSELFKATSSKSTKTATSSASPSTSIAHPLFKNVEKRAATLREIGKTDARLASFGFFHDITASLIKCYYCDLRFDLVRDDPVLKHVELRPDCQHARSVHQLHRMQKLSERIKSFKDSKFFPMHERLAKSGFFFRKADEMTQCAYCYLIVDSWKENEDVLTRHAQLAVTCPFILNTPNYALEEHLSPPPSPTEECTGVIVKHKDPIYTNMVSPDVRLKTFDDWTGVIDKHLLVECGLFSLKTLDYTKCFHCGGGLYSWQSEDDPWTEHARWYPHCEFIKLVKGTEFVEEATRKHLQLMGSIENSFEVSETALSPQLEMELNCILQNSDIRFYQNQGVTEKVIRVALKTFMVKNNRGFSTPEEIAEVLNTTLTLCPSTSSSSAGTEDESNQNPKQVDMTCIICLAKERAAVFLPCGHLVACYSCAASVSSCPVCRQRITKVIRTYTS